MTINGFIVSPDNVIIGASTEEGLDIVFAPADQVPRSALLEHGERLMAAYLGDHTLCDALKTKAPHDPGTTPQ